MTWFQGGQNICGASIGVICLESYFPKPPGHLKNPSSLDHGVIYEVVTGVTVPKLLADPSPELLQPFIDAARRLEAEGVRAITGSCGFLAIYQRELAAAVKVPVFSSSLIQVPLAFQISGGVAPVGVITASASALTDRHFAGVGADHVPVVVKGLEHCPEFSEVILRNDRNDMDLAKIEAELLQAAHELMAEAPEIRSIVLECTDLPPYAHRLQAALKLPVYDIMTLMRMMNEVMTRQPYAGIMPW